MIDPITAVAMATSAFKTVQKMVAMGRDVEDTFGQMGKWYSAVSDFNEAKTAICQFIEQFSVFIKACGKTYWISEGKAK